jgi:hypothetical protein
VNEITLTGEPKAHSRAGRKMRLALLVLLVVLGALLFERWRGQRALSTWRRQMTARGEIFDPVLIWPKPNLQNLQFSNHLAHATQQLPQELKAFAGIMSGMVVVEPGRARRGSQEPRPPFFDARNSTNTWEQLEAAVQQAAVEIENLRRLIKLAPPSMGDNILDRLKADRCPNFVSTRVGAQNLHAVAIHELHRGNLAGALENLEALSTFVQLYAEEPTLVNFMIRVALTGLSEDAYWDALQAPGWTDSQLALLQRASQFRPGLDGLPRVKQAERAGRLHTLQSFRSESYEAWLARYEQIYQSFGVKLPSGRTTAPARLWQQWVFHPLWAFAWADQEQLHYLKHSQLELDVVRESVKLGSWKHLNERLKALEQSYRPPAASWRFYGALPLVDTLSDIVGSSRPSKPVCPYPDFRKAWQVTFRSLTLREMTTTAIALKRHELRHGRPPASLEALVPEFLSALPRDLMDGQPLRYRLKPDGSFVLYSVGENGRDDGGNPRSEAARGKEGNDLLSGRDWVWPQAVPASVRPGA